MRFTSHDQKGRKPARLPLIGMIDVFFLLLVYFIVSTTLATPEDELSAALKQDNADAASSDILPQFVSIKPDSSGFVYELGGQQLRTQDLLQELLAELPKESGVFVRADDAVPVYAVAAALQACHDAGYEKITYVTPD